MTIDTAQPDNPDLQPHEYVPIYDAEAWATTDYEFGQIGVATYTEGNDPLPVRVLVSDPDDPESVVHEVSLAVEDAQRFHKFLTEAIERVQQGR